LRVARSIRELQIPKGQQVGLVPTMGAFHDGHLQLMRRSKQECGYTVVSLFVNPIQFGKGEDFANYPRNFANDSRMAESVGVNLIFAPSTEEMYPVSEMTVVKVPEVGRRWEGEHRPGHFEGVATIVAKLFNIVQPDVAYFGRKDFQQCAVIRKLVKDLNYRLTVEVEPTVREPDGLAMSSRNRYLSDEERIIAPTIYSTLSACRERLLAGIPVHQVLADGNAILESSGFRVDYLACIDDETLDPIQEVSTKSSLIFAGRLGKTRLIDNVSVK